MKASPSVVILIMLLSTLLAPLSARAQQVTGELGSPSATTTIDGKQLPAAADPKFGGVIKDDAMQSKPWWAPRIVPPKGAPNVLLIMTDDAGFGVPSTFGGVIPTPTMDRIAKDGLALQPHVPLHGALLADACGTDHRAQSSLGRASASSPSSPPASPATTASSARTRPPSARSCSTTATATSWFGKDHNTPALLRPARSVLSTSGRSAWASSISTASSAATTDQWTPNLFRNTTQIYPFAGQARLQPRHRPGGRRHRVDDADRMPADP